MYAQTQKTRCSLTNFIWCVFSPTVEGLSVSASNEISRTDEKVTFNVSLTAGSDVTISMHDNGVELASAFVKNVSIHSQTTFSHTFTSSRTRNVTFIANNTVSSLTVYVPLITEEPIGDFSVTYRCQPDRTVVFNWMVTAGSHITAVVYYDDSVVYVHFLEVVLSSQEFSHKFNASGVYPIRIHYHNSYSNGWVELNTTVETGIVIGDYNVSTLVAVNSVIDVTVPVLAGNTISVFVDNGDDARSYNEEFSADWDVIAAVAEVKFSVYYTRPGNYSFSCYYVNSASFVVHNYTIQVFHPIANLQVVSGAVMHDTAFEVIVLAHGSCIPDCSLHIGIGSTCFTKDLLLQSHENDTINETISVSTGCDEGVYDMSVELRNVISSAQDQQKMYVEVPIVNITGWIEFTTYNEVVFNTTLIMETNTFTPHGLTYTCVHHFYGDSHITVTYLPMSIQPNTIIQHNYTEPGDYEYNVTCFNRISLVQLFLEVNIINPDVPIEGLVIGYPHEPVAVDDVITFSLFIDRGNNVTFDFDFGDNTTGAITVVTPIETPISTNMSTNLSHAFNYSQTTGPFFVQLNASNAVSFELGAVYVDVHELVTGVSATAVKNHTKVGDSVFFTVSITTGTHAIAYMYPGDGTPHTVEYFVRHSSANPIEFSHIYSQPGKYRPQFVVNNTLSSANYTYPTDIVIQHPITGITLDAPSPVAVPTGVVVYGVDVPRTDPWPTDPFCKWTFVDRVVRMVVATPLASGQTYSETFTYNETHTGIQTGNVTCTNFVSTHTAFVDVMVQRKVEDATIQVVTPAVAIGKVAEFNITAIKGSHLKYKVNFKDGSVVEYVHPDPLNSVAAFTFEHRYVTEGNYSISIDVSNEVSSAVVVATEPVVVQLPLEGLSVSSDSPVGTPPGLVTYKVTAEENIHAKNMHLMWMFNDGAVAETQYTDSVTENTPVTKTHTYSGGTYTMFTTFVNCSNLISHFVINTTVVVEVVIEHASLNTSTRVASVGEAVTFTMDAQQGSNITYTLRSGDGEESKHNADTPVDFSHSYTDPGNYSVQLTAANDISQRSALPDKIVVVVQHPLVCDNLQLTCKDVMSTDLPEMPFVITVTDGTPEPTTVHLTVNMSTGQVSSLFVSHWPFRWILEVDSAVSGDVDINMTLSNLVSSCVLPRVLVVQEPITYLELTTPIVVKSGQQVNMTANMEKGSEMEGTVAFGDSSTEQVTWHGTVHSYMVTHIYTKAGIYSVTVSGKCHTSGSTKSPEARLANSSPCTLELTQQHPFFPTAILWELHYTRSPSQNPQPPSRPSLKL